jgi:hypothetical protein
VNIYSKLFGLLLGLALIAVLGWAAWLGLEFVGALFAALDAQVARVTAIGAAAVLAAAAIVAAAVRKGGEKSRGAQVQEQKVGVYRFFAECWQDPATAPLKFQALDRLLALHGGAAVIKAYSALRNVARQHGARHPDTLSQLGRVLLEMRKDLGTSAQGITALELRQLVIADPAPLAAHAGSGNS